MNTRNLLTKYLDIDFTCDGVRENETATGVWRFFEKLRKIQYIFYFLVYSEIKACFLYKFLIILFLENYQNKPSMIHVEPRLKLNPKPHSARI